MKEEKIVLPTEFTEIGGIVFILAFFIFTLKVHLSPFMGRSLLVILLFGTHSC